MSKSFIRKYLALAVLAGNGLCLAAQAGSLLMPNTDGASVAIDKLQSGRVGSLSFAPLPNGDAIAAWDISMSNGFMTLRGGTVDGEGTTGNGFDLLPLSATQKNDVDVGHADGGFLATWVARDSPGTKPKIVVQRFSLNGTPLPFGSTSAPKQIDQGAVPYVFSPAISTFGKTNALRTVLLWSNYDTGKSKSPSVVAQRLHKDGANYAGEIQLSGSGAFPDAARLANQRVVAVWSGARGITGRLFGAPGDDGSLFSVAASGDDASVVPTADGGFFVLWKEYSCNSCEPFGTGVIFARRFSASGLATGAAFKISERYNAQAPTPPADGNAPTEDDKPHAVLLTNGQMLVVWEAQSN